MTSVTDDLILLAPLQGWAMPVEETPDPVFADKMLGEGVAIDPTLGELRAPCAGEVLGVHESGHAVTVRSAFGAEILLHIGIETVGLGGHGFERLASAGQKIAAGDLLARFDLDVLAPLAKSLVSPMVITNGDEFAVAKAETGREVRLGEPIAWLRRVSALSAPVSEAASAAVVRALRVGLVHGVHARPAALLAREAAKFAATVTLSIGGRGANIRSAVSVMTLGIRSGDAIELTAAGEEAEAAIAALAPILLDANAHDSPLGAAKQPLVADTGRVDPDGALRGVSAAPGLAIGAVVRLVEPEIEVSEVSSTPGAERSALSRALDDVEADLRRRLDGHGADIVEAHLAFLDDPELRAAAYSSVEGGASAGIAWRGAIRAAIARLDALGDPRFAERGADLSDLERQVLLRLSGEPSAPATLPQNAIVLADDILPSQLIALDASRVAGLATSRGGPTSHVAILAQAMNIPAVVALGPRVLTVEDGALGILDGEAGRLKIAPGPAEIAAVQTRLADRRDRRARASAVAQEPCYMADGRRIEVFANVGSVQEAQSAWRGGAEGCGLLRTEFLFLDRRTPPDEQEQAAAYQAIADALQGRPLVIRTLDIGGDKPVAYLPLPPEDNPALGVRGVRVGLARPEMLQSQLRAILNVRPAPAIMLPMVASLAELLAARAMLEEVSRDARVARPSLGVMVETPAAAVTADILAAEADFLSIGTNDLAQYVLAMDRTNPRLAAEVDAMHPAVLRLIGQAADGASRHGRSIAVCGGLASDLTAASVLIGLGVTRLSATPSIIAELKGVVRGLTLTRCQGLAQEAIAQVSATDARAVAIAGAAEKQSEAGALA